MSLEILSLPDLSNEVTEAQQTLAAAKALEIVDTDTFTKAGDLLKGVNALRKKIERSYEPVVEAAHKSHKAALAARDEHTKPLGAIETVLRNKVGAYQAQERAKAEQAARAEQERVRVENDRLRAEAARLQRLEEEARLAKAADLERQGKLAEAAAVVEAPLPEIEVPVVVAAPVQAAPKLAGMSFQERWKGQLLDKHAFVAWCLESNALRYVEVTQSSLDELARGVKQVQSIHGVRIYTETGTTIRG